VILLGYLKDLHNSTKDIAKLYNDTVGFLWVIYYPIWLCVLFVISIINIIKNKQE